MNTNYGDAVGLFDFLFGKPAPGVPAELIASFDVPKEVLVLPLRNAVMFPGGVLPLAIGRASTFALIDEALARRDGLALLVAQRAVETDSPTPADLYELGTICRIVQVGPREAERQAITVQGLGRVRTLWYPRFDPPLLATVEAAPTMNYGFDGVEAATSALRALALKLIARLPEVPPAAAELVNEIVIPSHLTDLVTANLDVSLPDKQRVLEATDLRTRMLVVTALLTAKLAATTGPLLKVVPNDL